MADTKQQIVELLQKQGRSLAAAERESEAIIAGDRFDECPLMAAGFRLEGFVELPTIVIGPDDKCICTKTGRCLNVDRRDGCRCTLTELRLLDSQAISRRARQSGEC